MPASIAALLCVCGIVLGQLLFICTADSHAHTGCYFDVATAGWLLSALLLYGNTTFGWIWTLQQGSLGLLDPWMALVFALVSMLSAVCLRERLNLAYWLGLGLIVDVVGIAVRS